MQLSAEQVKWAQSSDPADAARLAQSLGLDMSDATAQSNPNWQLYHQITNYYGGGGQGYTLGGGNAPSQGWKIGTDLYQSAADQMVSEGKGTIKNGYYIPNPTGPTEFNPSSSWSGTATGGGFAGGTGTGVLGQNGIVTNGDTYTNWTPPVTPGASTSGTAGNTQSATGGPSALHPVGTPPVGTGGSPITGATGGATGGTTNGATSGTGAGGGGSTTLGSTGASGNLPTASASTYNSGSAYTPPDSVSSPWDFFNDPGYQFALKEGANAVNNSAAAKGGLLSGNTLKELSDRATGTASQYYGDAYNRYMQGKNFDQNVATDARNFNNSNNQFDATFNNNNRQWDTTFNNNNRIDARNFDYTAATGDRNFNEAQRQYDLGFNYNAANNDANRNTDTLKYLSGLGANANNGSSNLYAELAKLLSANNLTGAGANAAGNVGNANSLTNIFSSLYPWLVGSTGAGTATGTPTTTRPSSGGG